MIPALGCWLRTSLLVVALLWLHTAHAGIPDMYKPVPVEPPFSFSERVIDLNPAIKLAQAQNKPLFIYMGATDCPPCVDYQRFLEKHAATLVDVYSKFVVVDIRTWIKGPVLKFRVGDSSYKYHDFNELVGAAKAQFLFPHFWMLSSDMKLIKKLPPNVSPFLELENHKALLSM